MTTPGASPPAGVSHGSATSPQYVHSPNTAKRRRLSTDDDRDGERPSQVPRLYESPQLMNARHISPAARPAWGSHDPLNTSIVKPALPSVQPSSMDDRRTSESRPTLPSLPLLNFSQSSAEMQRLGSRSGDDYASEPARRASLAHSFSSRGPEMVQQQEHQPVNAAYDYHHSARGQPLSMAQIHPYDRTPFTPTAYGHAYHRDPYMRIGELGMAPNGEGKQRKRRGNLPKETTDKLRAWFVSHLQHPYPTEDEKQELMRQTGLQMSKLVPAILLWLWILEPWNHFAGKL